ncbi:MAG TPA: DnaJ domain-containing protein [Solirubrobacteraceae bacterium]|nr:DnaJ domain-containing protein [Solirubrobacteraceae bacterium]
MTGGGQVDPYAELGVSRDASSEEIRRAYRQVARRHHPDVNRDPGGSERFAAAARAYEVLNDPAARARYDNRFPAPVPIRRSPKPRPAVRRRAVLELTDREAAHLARFPLILTDAHGSRILVPAGTGDGDQLVLHARAELIVLHVRVPGKGLTVLD